MVLSPTFAVSVDTSVLLAATLGTSNVSVHLTVQVAQTPTTFYWRNDGTGENVFWQLNGTTIVNSGSMLRVADLNWKMVAATDLFHGRAFDRAGAGEAR